MEGGSKANKSASLLSMGSWIVWRILRSDALRPEICPEER